MEYKVGQKYKVGGTFLEAGNIIEIVKVEKTMNKCKVRYKTIKGKMPKGMGDIFVVGSGFDKELKRLQNECIVIYCNGTDTVALDKTTGEKAVARLHPDDEYDFYTGAKLAFERLTGGADQKEQPKQLYNGKVVCVDNKKNENVYTVGKIYQFKDGNFLDDNGRLMPDNDTIHTFRDWQEWTGSKFIEVVE